jgi:hypothetical protein
MDQLAGSHVAGAQRMVQRGQYQRRRRPLVGGPSRELGVPRRPGAERHHRFGRLRRQVGDDRNGLDQSKRRRAVVAFDTG